MSRLLLTLVFAALFSVAALAGPPSLVLVERHFNSITITRGVGQTEKIDALPANQTRNNQANVEQLHTVFSKLYVEGYTLQNSTNVTGAYDVTYVFVKP